MKGAGTGKLFAARGFLLLRRVVASQTEEALWQTPILGLAVARDRFRDHKCYGILTFA